MATAPFPTYEQAGLTPPVPPPPPDGSTGGSTLSDLSMFFSTIGSTVGNVYRQVSTPVVPAGVGIGSASASIGGLKTAITSADSKSILLLVAAGFGIAFAIKLLRK